MFTQATAASLARGWIEAWRRMDLAWLREHLAPDFVHTSPFGTLSGRDHYLRIVEPMARQSVMKLTIVDVIAADDRAVVWFENITSAGPVPTCDWLRFEGGRIAEIQSFYDTNVVRDVLTPDEQRRLNEA